MIFQREPVRIAPTGALLHPAPAGVTGAGIHSHAPAAAHAAEDWFNGPECAAILAQPVEPCTENPFAGDCEPDLEIDA